MPPRTLPGFGAHLTVHPFEVPLRTRFRGVDVRRGVLLSGPSGWGEFSAFEEYDDAYAKRWLQSAVACARDPWPRPVREMVEVNSTVPAVEPEVAKRLVREAGAATVKVKVAERGQDPGEDIERVAAVRDELGPQGWIRIDANGAWTVDEARRRIDELFRAAKGLEYVEQPCATLEELSELRRKIDVPIAVDELIRRAEDPLAVAAAEAADIVVLKVQPLGGPRAAMEVAERCGLPVVVSSALETSIGLAAGLAFAAALPELRHACGLGTAQLLGADVTGQSLLPEGGWLHVRGAVPTPAQLEAVRPEWRVEQALLERLDRISVVDSPYQ